jgi:hydroxymethylglutaryl-CoA lyase
MQGLSEFIPTAEKIRYINQLLTVGFDTIDFGSFVSPKAIPQLRDTREVLEQIDWRNSTSKLLAIVANTRGAQEASQYEGIRYLGFPLSVSETFQQRNTNKSIDEALDTVKAIQDICVSSNKELVAYISMGFGNPYGDPYNVDLVGNFAETLASIGVRIISLADTIGVSTPDIIEYLFTSLSTRYPHIEWGAHLHSNPRYAIERIEAAYRSGCKRFDGAIRGFGGCPMADDDLVGNLATETIVFWLEKEGVQTGLDKTSFGKALQIADEIFPKH